MNNILKLRREAYRMWGLKPKQVIYNTPTIYGFKFKIDYSDGHESWPKAYTLSKPDGEEINRIIMPILMLNKIKDTQIVIPGWYDMPVEMHKILVNLISKPLYRQLNFNQRFCNVFLPKAKKFKSLIPVEDYVFNVKIKNKTMLVSLD
jgi:hypothetical protein